MAKSNSMKNYELHLKELLKLVRKRRFSEENEKRKYYRLDGLAL